MNYDIYNFKPAERRDFFCAKRISQNVINYNILSPQKVGAFLFYIAHKQPRNAEHKALLERGAFNRFRLKFRVDRHKPHPIFAFDIFDLFQRRIFPLVKHRADFAASVQGGLSQNENFVAVHINRVHAVAMDGQNKEFFLFVAA